MAGPERTSGKPDDARSERQRRQGPTVIVVFGVLTLLGCVDAVAGAAQKNWILFVIGVAVAGASYYGFRHWRRVMRELR